MKPKHTPGPWRIETENETGIPTISIRDGLNQQIATVNPYRLAWRDADAHLIAAAPDMLKALNKFAHDIEALKHSTDEADFPLELAEYSTTYLEPYLKQLIAKAKGGA